MLTYIIIILFIIVLFFDYQYKTSSVKSDFIESKDIVETKDMVKNIKENMRGGLGGGGIRGSNLYDLNNNTLSQDMSEETDIIKSVYEPPTKNNMEGFKGIETYTSYNNFSFAMSNTPPLSINNSVNLRKPINYGNFTKFGKIPPNPVATTCFLDFNCSNYPYDVDERSENVCKRCIPHPLKQNYDKSATYVMGREAGLPRQIRKIF
jgi:hypothetical protein